MITEENIIKAFDYFNKAKYGRAARTYTPSEKDIKVISTYFKLLQKSYGVIAASLSKDYLWTYFSVQFNYWDPLTINSFHKKITLPLIVGKKAFDRFETRDREYDWQFQSLIIITKYKLSKQEFVNFVFAKEEEKDEEKDSYAFYRSIKHNTEEGFIFCIQNTDLFCNDSKWCMLCKYKQDCKKIKNDTFERRRD